MFAKIFETEGRQILITRALVRGHGPALTISTAMPDGFVIEKIIDQAESPTEHAWPAINAQWNDITAAIAMIWLKPLIAARMAASNPDDEVPMDLAS